MKYKIAPLFISLILLISASVSLAADKDEVEYKNMEEMLGAIRLEKIQVESMIEKLVISGRITKEEGSKAKREIASIKDDDLENIKTSAIAELRSKKIVEH